MSDLAWRAEGMAVAIAAGGVVLEKYRRPGFAGEMAVRRLYGDAALEQCAEDCVVEFVVEDDEDDE